MYFFIFKYNNNPLITPCAQASLTYTFEAFAKQAQSYDFLRNNG